MSDSGVLPNQPTVPAASGAVAEIRKQAVGAVAIGDDVLFLGSGHGGLLDVASSGGRLTVRPKPRPVMALPPEPRTVLERGPVWSAAARALEDGHPVEFHGEPGVGKTALLQHLAHAPPVHPPGGVVYLSTRSQPVDDVLQQIHDLFIASTPPRKATHQQIRNALADLQALVLLDDVNLDTRELGTLLEALPHSAVIIATDVPRLGQRGCSIRLAGLTVDQGLRLLQQTLGHPPTGQDVPAAVAVIQALEGNPLRLRQHFSLLNLSGNTLPRLAARLSTGAQRPGDAVGPDAGSGVPGPELRPQSLAEFRLLAVLAAVPDATMSVGHLAVLADLPDPFETLQWLEHRGLVAQEGGGGHYRLAGQVPVVLAAQPEIEPWRRRALQYFAALAAAYRSQPGRLTDAVGPSCVLLRWAIDTERWAAALDLARGIEGVLALERRWAAWAQVLQAAHMAARALKDEPAQAWVLHQLGTRALCLGSEAGHTALVEALRIRERVGDRTGAEVTRNNLVCPLSALAATGSFSRIRAERRAEDPTQPLGSRGAAGPRSASAEPPEPSGHTGRIRQAAPRSARTVKPTVVLLVLGALAVAIGALVVVSSGSADPPDEQNGSSPVPSTAARVLAWPSPTMRPVVLPPETSAGVAPADLSDWAEDPQVASDAGRDGLAATDGVAASSPSPSAPATPGPRPSGQQPSPPQPTAPVTPRSTTSSSRSPGATASPPATPTAPTPSSSPPSPSEPTADPSPPTEDPDPDETPTPLANPQPSPSGR